MINDKNSIQLIPLTLEITSELLKGCQNNFTHAFFGKVWKSSENCWKYAEVAGTFFRNSCHNRKKSHALKGLCHGSPVHFL